MSQTIVISDKGYCQEVLRQMTEISEICPNTTMLIVAARDRYQRSVSRVYYEDGTVVDTLLSTNRLINKLEYVLGVSRCNQVEAYYRLLPPSLSGQMRSWVMQNHAFVPVTSYKSGPTTWINVRHIVAVQTRGLRTNIVLSDGSVIQITKHKEKFLKQLSATKVVSLWMTQYALGHGDRFDKMVLSCVDWPREASQHVDRQRLRDMLLVITLEEHLAHVTEANVKKMLRGLMVHLMQHIDKEKDVRKD